MPNREAVDDEIRLLAVGDIHPDREEPKTLFEGVDSLFKLADFRFGQLECTISDKGVLRTDVRNPAHRVHPRNVEALTSAPFDMVSYAGNNQLDYGLDAFEDTLRRLTENGIQYVGAGMDLAEATSPRVISLKDTRISFVNFCSILRDGYVATQERPGISPLRVATFYQPLENIYEQPGTPARTVTVIDERDLERVRTAVSVAKTDADVCIALFHWGVHFTHDLSPYQPLVAQVAIDSGADMIIGTHPHCLQAIDVYRGKPIFYSLGNFALEQNRDLATKGVLEYLAFYGMEMDNLDNHPHPIHCRKTLAVNVVIRNKQIDRVEVIPVFFSDRGRPETLERENPVFDEIRHLMDELCEETGARIHWSGSKGTVSVEKSREINTREVLEARAVSYPWLIRLASGLVKK